MGEKRMLLFYSSFIGLQNITIYTNPIQWNEKNKTSLKSRNHHVAAPTMSCRNTDPTTCFLVTTSDVSCRDTKLSA